MVEYYSDTTRRRQLERDIAQTELKFKAYTKKIDALSSGLIAMKIELATMPEDYPEEKP